MVQLVLIFLSDMLLVVNKVLHPEQNIPAMRTRLLHCMSCRVALVSQKPLSDSLESSSFRKTGKIERQFSSYTANAKHTKHRLTS